MSNCIGMYRLNYLVIKNPLKLFVYWVILHALLSSADFFQNKLFPNTECQTVWILIRSLTDILLGLIWVQTVCQGYQQKTQVGKELKSYPGALCPCIQTEGTY